MILKNLLKLILISKVSLEKFVKNAFDKMKFLLEKIFVSLLGSEEEYDKLYKFFENLGFASKRRMNLQQKKQMLFDLKKYMSFIPVYDIETIFQEARFYRYGSGKMSKTMIVVYFDDNIELIFVDLLNCQVATWYK